MKNILVSMQIVLLVFLMTIGAGRPLLAQAAPVKPAAVSSSPQPTSAAAAPATAPAVPAAPAAAAAATAQGVTPPPDYVIGPDDLLAIVFWREKDLSAEAMVRPDGRISIPLLNDVQAAGLTPDQLREKLMAEAARFVEDPNATVVVKQINSRKFYITGQVNKPGMYPLTNPMTILQAISMVGGLLEYADNNHIVVMRTENGKPANYRFNYDEVIHQKNLKQNILLKPGDTIVVP